MDAPWRWRCGPAWSGRVGGVGASPAQGLGLCWEALCQQMDVQLRPEAQALLMID